MWLKVYSILNFSRKSITSRSIAARYGVCGGNVLGCRWKVEQSGPRIWMKGRFSQKNSPKSWAETHASHSRVVV